MDVIELEDRHGGARDETRSDGAEAGPRRITCEIVVHRVTKLGGGKWQMECKLPGGG